MIKILTKKQYREMENTIERCIETNQRLNKELDAVNAKLERAFNKVEKQKEEIKVLENLNKRIEQDYKECKVELEYRCDLSLSQEKELEKQRDTNKKLRLENQTLIDDLKSIRKELEETKKELEQKNQKKKTKSVAEIWGESITNKVSKIIGETNEIEQPKNLTEKTKSVAEVTDKPKTKKTSRKVKGDK